MRLRQNETPSYISAYVNYEHEKLLDDTSTLAKQYAWGIINYLAQKEEFVLEIYIIRGEFNS